MRFNLSLVAAMAMAGIYPMALAQSSGSQAGPIPPTLTTEAAALHDMYDHWDHREPFITDSPDGGIYVGDLQFDSWTHYVQSDFFKKAGLRCGTPDDGFGPDFDPSDCSFDLTDPKEKYDPSVAQYCIPVVFHVIRADDGTTGDVSEERIRSQIAVLNEDFLALSGSNGQNGINCQIRFVLARVDPSGNPTNGITYTNNTQWFNDQGTYYETLAWDPNRYLNIYSNIPHRGLLGYVPWFPAAADANVGGKDDRVMLLWSTIGKNAPIGPPFDLGRTGTHEVGHYLGLFHTFQNGCGAACDSTGDRICDTNPEEIRNTGCSPRETCGNPDPITNYMDYSDDACMEQFTPNQARRARCTLESYRADLVFNSRKLLPTIGAEGENFGKAVGTDGTTAIVGANRDSQNGFWAGAAYLFDLTTGEQNFKLLPSDPSVQDVFGWSVAVDANKAIVGAPWNDDNGNSTGSAYIFNVTTGQQQFKILPDDSVANDEFGWSVAVSGNTAVIGSADRVDRSGAAYAFDVTTGGQISKFNYRDAADQDWFGNAVAISGNLAIVGAFGKADNGSDSGAAYIFDVSTGAQLLKLLPDDGSAGDNFGVSVGISGNIAIIGAARSDDQAQDSGSAYLFNATTGEQIVKLLPSEGAETDNFGISVAISGTTAIVGVRHDDDNGSNSGSAYLFDLTTGNQVAKIKPNDGAASDAFGTGVAIKGGTAIVGAWGDDDNGSASGSAYLFAVGSNPNCLHLNVENLVAGERAIFTITGGLPGARGITVYGTTPGRTKVTNYAGFCATFGIRGINLNQVIGGTNRNFDANGRITFGLNIPQGSAGFHVLMQSAERGTCPDERVSNLVELTVQ